MLDYTCIRYPSAVLPDTRRIESGGAAYHTAPTQSTRQGRAWRRPGHPRRARTPSSCTSCCRCDPICREATRNRVSAHLQAGSNQPAVGARGNRTPARRPIRRPPTTRGSPVWVGEGEHLLRVGQRVDLVELHHVGRLEVLQVAVRLHVTVQLVGGDWGLRHGGIAALKKTASTRDEGRVAARFLGAEYCLTATLAKGSNDSRGQAGLLRARCESAAARASADAVISRPWKRGPVLPA